MLVFGRQPSFVKLSHCGAMIIFFGSKLSDHDSTILNMTEIWQAGCIGCFRLTAILQQYGNAD